MSESSITGRGALAGAFALIAGILLFGVAGDTGAQQDAKKSADLPHPVVDTHELMSLFNLPLYQYLKQTMQQQPENEEQWKTIADRGWQTAEVANLVAMRKDTDQWRSSSARLQQAGIDLAKAGEAQSWDEAQSAYRTVIQRCNACHQASAPDHAPQLKP